ncbi:type II secretion system protein GspH [Burkholderia lata]|uniref:Type II secretion system protein H n=1 Tax=Burkholderia lata (strain ATCC 17760 / DSM 23089 / LMG 22485 / NCIMB 9086 / R18194 / 383) TaxID=482957 RepID=A0A6P3BUI6_BURL3|nr:GspH/FimT family pseudopilin [Burkholderia lata]VWD58759.1 type II secretion system protein GspH [Burkholderia lata]
MLAIRTTFRCGRDCRARRGAASSVPARVDGGRASRGARRHRARGFTLLEMLVVLVIAGLLVSLASLSLTRNPRTDLREEAQRIALLFETAGDEAQVRARPIAWQPTAHGFHFDVSSPDGWRTLRDDLLRPRDWDGGVTGADIDYPGSDTHANRVVFGTESIDTPVRVTLHSAVGSATIVGTGNGRYEVQ